MTLTPGEAIDPSQWDWIDSRVRRFERDRLESHAEVHYQNYLEGTGQVFHMLLIELVYSDLEYQLQNHQEIHASDYLSRHPQLANDSAVVAELIWSEYEWRKNIDPQFTLEMLMEWYPWMKDHGMENAVGMSRHPSFLVRQEFENSPRLPGFTIHEKIGHGGMGMVYRATDLSLDRVSAIKFMIQGTVATDEERQRFLREAQIVASLQHPNILELFQVGQMRGEPYLVMEYASRGSLSHCLGGQPMLPIEAAKTLRQVCSGVAAMHERSIIHRDLKPSNILITESGIPKISDFGLARRVDMQQSQPKTQTLIGTPSYIAPECLFAKASPLSVQSDIYSLGAILYELLTGRAPFVGTSILDVLSQIKDGEVLPPRKLIPSIPRDIETICLKCLDVPLRRYASANELEQDLLRFLEGKLVHARPHSPLFRGIRWARRHPMTFGLLLLSALCLMLLTTGSIWIAWRESISHKTQVDLRRHADQMKEEAEQFAADANRESVAAAEALQILQDVFQDTDSGIFQSPRLNGQTRLMFDVSARELVTGAIANLGDRLKHNPYSRGRLLATIGTLAFHVGMQDESTRILNESLLLLEDSAQGNSLTAAQVLHTLGRTETHNQRYLESERHLARASAIVKTLDLSESTLSHEIRISRAWLAAASGNRQIAQDFLGETQAAVKAMDESLGMTHPSAVMAKIALFRNQALIDHNIQAAIRACENLYLSVEKTNLHPFYRAILLDQLVEAYQRMENTDKALEYVDLALRELKLAIGDAPHPLAAEVFSNSAWVYHCYGDEKRALEMMKKSVAIVIADEEMSLKNQSMISEFAMRLRDSGQHNEILRLAGDETLPGPWHPWRTLGFFTIVLPEHMDRGQYDEPLRIYERMCEASEHRAEAEPFYLSYCAMADALRGNYALAKQRIEQSLQWTLDKSPFSEATLSRIRLVQSLCGDNQPTSPSVQNIGFSPILETAQSHLRSFHQDDWPTIFDECMRQSKLFTVDQWKAASQGNRTRQNSSHPAMAGVHLGLAERLRSEGQFELALASGQRSIEILEASLVTSARQTITAYRWMADSYASMGEHDRAMSAIQHALALVTEAAGDLHLSTFEVRLHLFRLQVNAGHAAAIVCDLSEWIEVVESVLGSHHPFYSECVTLKSHTLMAMGDRNAALTFLEPIVLAAQDAIPPGGRVRVELEHALAVINEE